MIRILVVDDQISMRKMYKVIFKSTQYEVDFAIDGEDGYKQATSKNYQLIITDYVMPKVDGIQLLKKLKGLSQYKYIPILVASTKSNTSLTKLGKEAGACGWIVKPIDADRLLGGVKKLVG